MENARLITETREALEQQTATAEVLQVINSLARRSRAGVRRDARQGPAPVRRRPRHVSWTYDGECFTRAVAACRALQSGRGNTAASGQNSVPFKMLVRGEPLLHAVDIAETDAYRDGELLLGRWSILAVPAVL